MANVQFNGILPLPIMEAYVGVRANLILWQPTFTASIVYQPTAQMSGVLPRFILTASAHQDGIVSLRGNLPPLRLSASASQSNIARLQFGILPMVQLSAHALIGGVARLNASLPMPTLVSHSYWTKGITFNATLPIFTLFARLHSVDINILVMNTKNLAVTRYDHYPFNSMCYLNGQLIGAQSNGIYSLTGDMDNGTIIPWKVRIEKYDLTSSYRRQTFKDRIRYVWLTGEMSGDIIMTLEDYNGNRWDYLTEIVSTNAHEVKLKAGKGIKTRYLSIELSPGDIGAAVILDHISLYGLTTKKPR